MTQPWDERKHPRAAAGRFARKREGKQPAAKQQFGGEGRVEEVVRKTWKLVAGDLGGEIPAIRIIRPGENIKKPDPLAVMWVADSDDPTALTPGKPRTVYITPGSARALQSTHPGARRTAQRHLFHEFKHARQTEEELRDPVGREAGASTFARNHTHLLRPKNKKKRKKLREGVEMPDIKYIEERIEEAAEARQAAITPEGYTRARAREGYWHVALLEAVDSYELTEEDLAVIDNLDLSEVSSRAYPDLERVPGKQNWVDKAGGLPSYIERIAKHLHYEKGMTISHAIAVAVNTVKRWCKGGTVSRTGGPQGPQNVTAKTKAQACAAVAQWNAKRAKGKAS